MEQLTTIRELEVCDWEEILRVSLDEGYNRVNRLLEDFRAGRNRFDSPGETLLAHVHDNSVVAVCGLNREEETCFRMAGRMAGRIRRLYVVPALRGKGLARSLVEGLISFAFGHHNTITVNVGKLPSRTFYEHLGFSPVEHPHITHVKQLTKGR